METVGGKHILWTWDLDRTGHALPGAKSLQCILECIPSPTSEGFDLVDALRWI